MLCIVSVLFCVLFLVLYIALSFLFLYKSADHCHLVKTQFVCLFVCSWRDSPQWARAFSFTRFLPVDHTQSRNTVGRIPLDEWSARRSDLYLTTHITNKCQCPGGIRTHNLSRRAAADLRLRPRGHWDRLETRLQEINIISVSYIRYTNTSLWRLHSTYIPFDTWVTRWKQNGQITNLPTLHTKTRNQLKPALSKIKIRNYIELFEAGCATSRTAPGSIPGGVIGFFGVIFLPTVPWPWGRISP